MLHVHTLNRANALGEGEDFRLAKGWGGEPTLVLLPDHGRVEAFLNRGPDAERGSKDFVAFVVPHNQIRAITGAQLINRTKQVVLRIAGKDIGHSWFHANTDQSEAVGLLPVPCGSELLVTELYTGFGIRVGGVGQGQGHRHVKVVSIGGERASKDGLHELGLYRVHHVSGTVTLRDLSHALRLRCIDLVSDEATFDGGSTVLGLEPFDGALGTSDVVVGHHHELKEGPTCGNLGNGVSDATSANKQNSHASDVTPGIGKCV